MKESFSFDSFFILFFYLYCAMCILNQEHCIKLLFLFELYPLTVLLSSLNNFLLFCSIQIKKFCVGILSDALLTSNYIVVG